jgi:hypothetical protein
MKRYRILTLPALIIFVFMLPLHAQLSHKGFTRVYWGSLTQADAGYSVLQNTFDWRLDYRNRNSAFLINPVFNYDALKIDTDISLRQAYIDLYWANFDLRLGKQQIIWGKAEGVFITDVISPKNLSEFILPDFEEIRIGINAAKLDYFLGNSTIELVWIPSFQPNIAPQKGSVWEFTPKFKQKVYYDYSHASVSDKLSNSEAALKFSHLSSSIDFELMAAWLWDDNPALHIYTQIDSSLLIIPEYHRLPLTGAGFSKNLGSIVVRGEAACYFDKYLTSSDLSQNALARKNYLHYLLGIDHNLLNIDYSLQFIQEYITAYENIIQNDQLTTAITIFASKSLLRETLQLSVLAYCGLNEKDSLIRPKISYDFSDGINLQLGANIFTGNDGNFGRYSQNDMLYLKNKYSF